MENNDLIRSNVINAKFGFVKYQWVKEFVFSKILEQYVALASEDDENIVVIDVFGDAVETNF